MSHSNRIMLWRNGNDYKKKLYNGSHTQRKFGYEINRNWTKKKNV